TVAVDTVPPGVAATSLPDLTAANTASYAFSVTYADNVAVDSASLGDGNLLVTGANGFSRLATFVAASASGGGLTATYRLDAAAGTWGQADNGTYTVALLPNQVRDTSGNVTAAQALGTFRVAIDTTPPAVQAVSLPIVTAGNGTDYTFSVTFTDNVAIDASS